MPRHLALAGGLIVAASLPTADAHHGFAVHYDPNRYITIEGTVRQFDFVNPHAVLYIDSTRKKSYTDVDFLLFDAVGAAAAQALRAARLAHALRAEKENVEKLNTALSSTVKSQEQELVVARAERDRVRRELALRHEYSDIVSRGRIESTPPLPEEANEPELTDLPRIKLWFNMRDYGRLRSMIDVLNRG